MGNGVDSECEYIALLVRKEDTTSLKQISIGGTISLTCATIAWKSIRRNVGILKKLATSVSSIVAMVFFQKHTLLLEKHGLFWSKNSKKSMINLGLRTTKRIYAWAASKIGLLRRD